MENQNDLVKIKEAITLTLNDENIDAAGSIYLVPGPGVTFQQRVIMTSCLLQGEI
ncbi:MAG TPA: hypothetical protein VK469_09085 [Candidatus Kapabacteria bacterium]|nr:hypothetical protein [Candidatus Kapabacteria bacterium]